MAFRVVQFGPTRYQGGVAVAIKQLSKGLAKNGHQVVLVGKGGTNLDEVIRAGVQYHDRGWTDSPGLNFKLVIAERRIGTRLFRYGSRSEFRPEAGPS